MVYTKHYLSPLGGILLAADEVGLMGLWFDGEKYYADNLPKEHTEEETPILSEASLWLDVYFTGKEPDFMPPLHPIGSAFRREVWEILLQIPYGATATYGDISKRLAKRWDLKKCPRRRLEALSDIMRYRLSFHATESLERAEALRDMRAV